MLTSKIFSWQERWGKNNPIFEPREIGNTGFKMPPIMEKEEFDQLWEQVRGGQKISINNFIEG